MANSILYLIKRKTDKYINTRKSDLLTSVLLNKPVLLLCLLCIRCILSQMLVSFLKVSREDPEEVSQQVFLKEKTDVYQHRTLLF